MKKRLLKLVLGAIIFAVLTSCKKDVPDLQYATCKVDDDKEIVSHDRNEDLRGIDPSGVLNALAEEYGILYDFSNKISARPVTNGRTVSMWIVPSLWDSNAWLTILVNPSAQIIGLYEILYDSKSVTKDSDNRFSAGFYINDVDTYSWIIECSASVNVYGLTDRLHIYNNISIPSNYPYPLFDNISSGYFDLSTYSPTTSDPYADLALRVAATFYNNFY